jgi:F-type H+-transporting ATPase subunit gamma
MPSTRDIRRRIKSVKNTSQITKAMQMVAASKMRHAQEAALKSRPFADGLNRVMRSLSRRADEIEHPLWDDANPETSKPCYLIVSTDKGLCGGLNTNLFRELSKLPKDAAYVTVGRRAKRFVVKTGRNLLADFPLRERPTFMQSKTISKYLIEEFEKGEIDEVHVLYTEFVNTLVQQPKANLVLPVKELGEISVGIGAQDKETAKSESQNTTDELDYLYEPDAETVINQFFPKYVHFQVYHMLLEAQASEHSARMVAMKNATENAKNLISDLTLEYNKARQTAITNEILEISAAQLAME